MMQFIGPDPSEIQHQQLLDFHKLRNKIFVDELKWDLCSVFGFEWDQYDTPLARYALALQDNQVVGGARIAPTQCSLPQFETDAYTFMLGDFASGRIVSPVNGVPLTGIPLSGSKDIWEITRFISPSYSTYFELLQRCKAWLKIQNVSAVLSFSESRTIKLLHRMGYQAERTTPDIEFGGRNYCGILTKEVILNAH